MATISSLSAPGVEVREYDESLRISQNTGTTVFVPGFAAQGPVDEVTTISSISDFETIYGTPTNAAERYFYHTVNAILSNSGIGTTVLTSRLPYGSGEGDTVANAYTLLAYPAIPVTKKSSDDNPKGYDYYAPEGSIVDSVASGIYDAFTLVNTTVEEGEPNRYITPLLVDSEVTLTSAGKDVVNSNTEEEKRIVELGYLKYSTDEGGQPTSFIPALSATSINEENKPSISISLGEVILSSSQSVNGLRVDVCPSWDDKNEILTIYVACPLYNGTVHYGYFMATATYKADADLINSLFTRSKDDDDYNEMKNFSKVIFKYEEDEKILAAFMPTFNTDAESISNFNPDSNDVTYLIGAPAEYNISLNEYYTIIAGEYFKWSNENNTFEDIDAEEDLEGTSRPLGGNLKDVIANAAFIAINASRTTINDQYEGYYIGVTDNLFNTPSDDYIYNSIKSVQFTNWNRQSSADNTECIGIVDKQFKHDDFTEISSNRLDFYLDSNNKGSISNILQTTSTQFDTSSSDYDDTINLGIFKLAKSTVGTESLKLTYSVVEQYNAAFGKNRTYSISTAVSPQSYFIESIVDGSRNIVIMVNPYIANKIDIDINGILRGKVRFFASKLVDNYRYYEKKYLGSSISTTTYNSLMTPINIAKNNIKNWQNLVDRIGVPLELLDTIEENVSNSPYELFNKTDSLYPFATYTVPKKNNKFIGNVPSKLTRTLELISNDEEYPDIDILVEGGLSTIYAYSNAKNIISEGSSSIFFTEDNTATTDETNVNENIFSEDMILAGVEDMRTTRSSITEDAQSVIEDYLAVQNAFMTIANSFQNGGRGDTFYVADVLRGILIRGKDTKVEKLYGTRLTNSVYADSDLVNHSWSTSIYSPIKHLIESFTSSYASVYAQWLKVNDASTSDKCWVPASGYMTALMCASDTLQGPWYAAAGLNRGIVNGVLDCAVNPNQKQRGDLYKICVNSVPKLANIGIVCWGIRTLSKKASAFDQNTCRRTFLFIEKAIKKLLRYYLFEPNNSYTQLSIYNEIEPYMESIRNQGGIYSYTVVCDSSNNTPEIVNNGNLAVDVSVAPTRTAEFIVLNMTANKYSQEVSTTEMVG